jgi:tellurite methyltransferase
MAEADTSAWTNFHQAALGRPPRELMIRALNFFKAEGRSPGVAVDLGCGSGPDTAELLRRGWQVHAVDAEAEGLRMLRETIPAQATARLHTYAQKVTDFAFPRCDFVWGSFAYPFCASHGWPQLLERITEALVPGGRIAGDLFGERHAWAAEEGVMVLTERQARNSLQALALEAFDIEDGLRVSGGQVTAWHAFGLIACKQSPRGDA